MHLIQLIQALSLVNYLQHNNYFLLFHTVQSNVKHLCSAHTCLAVYCDYHYDKNSRVKFHPQSFKNKIINKINKIKNKITAIIICKKVFF